MSSIIKNDVSLESKQDAGNSSLSSIDTKLSSQATATNQSTGNSSLNSIDGKLTSLNAKDFATSTKQDILSAKFPTTLGQTTRANSLSVALASDQGTITTSVSGTVTVDTELPSAAVPNDTDSNSTSIPAVLARLQGFNGSSWDRIRQGFSAVTSIVTGYINNLSFAQYSTSPGTLTNGQFTVLMSDVNRNLKVSDSLNDATNSVSPTVNKKLAVSTYSPLSYRNAGAANSATIKSSIGNIFSFACENKNGSTKAYIQFWDTIIGAGSGTLIKEFLIPPSSQMIIGEDYFTQSGINFSTGISFGFSSTSNTFTGATASDMNLQVCYK